MSEMPRTKAGKKLLRDMGFSTRAWSERADRMTAAIVAIEAEAFAARDSAGAGWRAAIGPISEREEAVAVIEELLALPASPRGVQARDHARDLLARLSAPQEEKS